MCSTGYRGVGSSTPVPGQYIRGECEWWVRFPNRRSLLREGCLLCRHRSRAELCRQMCAPSTNISLETRRVPCVLFRTEQRRRGAAAGRRLTWRRARGRRVGRQRQHTEKHRHSPEKEKKKKKKETCFSKKNRRPSGAVTSHRSPRSVALSAKKNKVDFCTLCDTLRLFLFLVQNILDC